MSDWISVEDDFPDFRVHGFHTGRKVGFRTADGIEREGRYEGWGMFDDKPSAIPWFDVGFVEDSKRVTHWKSIPESSGQHALVLENKP